MSATSDLRRGRGLLAALGVAAIAAAAVALAFAGADAGAARLQEPPAATPAPSGASAHPAIGGDGLCLACHADIAGETEHASGHGGGRADCVSCHDPHVARHPHLLRRTAPRLCTQCHTDLRDELREPVVHAAMQDEASCLACHGPHGSPHDGLLRSAAGELCAGCHAPIAARAALEVPHLPAAGGDCGACHAPHSGADLALLVEPAPALCAGCHPVDANLRKAHGGFALADTDCGSCHDPHGTADAALIRAVSHLPFASGDCASCHADPARPAAGLEGPTSNCEDCHAGYRDSAGHHPVGDAARCVDCHSPHAGEAPGMTAGPQRAVCLGCHGDVREAILAGASRHPANLEQGACSACHAGHGATTAPLLRAGLHGLCESCHTDHSKFAHPMGPNVPDPRREGATLTCLSCHDPHASEHPMLLTASSERDLCVECHAALH